MNTVPALRVVNAVVEMPGVKSFVLCQILALGRMTFYCDMVCSDVTNVELRYEWVFIKEIVHCAKTMQPRPPHLERNQ